MLSDIEKADVIHVIDEAEIVRWLLEHGAGLEDARVGDHEVEASARLGDRGEGAPHGRFIAHIDVDGIDNRAVSLCRKFLRESLSSGQIDVGDPDHRARVREPARDLGAKALGAARHEGDLCADNLGARSAGEQARVAGRLGGDLVAAVERFERNEVVAGERLAPFVFDIEAGVTASELAADSLSLAGFQRLPQCRSECAVVDGRAGSDIGEGELEALCRTGFVTGARLHHTREGSLGQDESAHNGCDDFWDRVGVHWRYSSNK